MDNRTGMSFIYFQYVTGWLLSVLCTLGGLYLVYSGATGGVDIDAFGVKVNTAVPGVAFGFIGYIILRLTYSAHKNIVDRISDAVRVNKDIMREAASSSAAIAQVAGTPDHLIAHDLSLVHKVLSTDLPRYEEWRTAIEAKKRVDGEIEKRLRLNM